MDFWLFIGFVVVLIAVSVFFKKNAEKRAKELQEEQLKEEIRVFEEPAISMTPEKFFELRTNLIKNKKHLARKADFNFAGIYILHNLTKDKHYVGQSVHVMKRVNMHFGGKRSGNKDVYKDYMKGDQWNIQLLRLEDTRFFDLNALEKYAIKLYKSFDQGYNKTRGNNS